MKNFNWKQFILAVITAVLAGFGVNQATSPTAHEIAAEAAAINTAAAPFTASAAPTPDCGTGPEGCALYHVEVFYNAEVVTGGSGLPELKFLVPAYATHSIYIPGVYTPEKAKRALVGKEPYPNWKFDRVWSYRFVQWARSPSQGSEQPTPDPGGSETE